VRWLEYDLPPLRAGAIAIATVLLENAGDVAWDSRAGTGICIGYHWLDRLGNPVVWDGLLSAFPEVVSPGERVEVFISIAGPIPAGDYRIALDLVDGGRCWFEEVGNTRLELDVPVLARLDGRALGVVLSGGDSELAAITHEALQRQKETLDDCSEITAFLPAGALPPPDWSTKVLDAHAEGYGAVGGSIGVRGSRFTRRKERAELEPWRTAKGRQPGWSRPLLCPSLHRDVVQRVRWLEPVAGLPAVSLPDFPDRWLWDGTISLEIDARALRRDDRRSA
jgi:hypothetical protein